MKQFYTVRDIEDMHASGVKQIEIHDDVVLTDVAREKAIALGMQLIPMEPADNSRQGPAMPRMAAGSRTKTGSSAPGALPSRPVETTASHALPQATQVAAPNDPVQKIKAAVVARLGTDKYNQLLDKIIPQVMSQLKK
jgi:hypothetical protein